MSGNQVRTDGRMDGGTDGRMVTIHLLTLEDRKRRRCEIIAFKILNQLDNGDIELLFEKKEESIYW